MLAQQLLISNLEEIIQADKLGLSEPKRVLVTRKMVINIHDVSLAYCNTDGNIELSIDGLFYEVKYTEVLWTILVDTINERKNARA